MSIPTYCWEIKAREMGRPWVVQANAFSSPGESREETHCQIDCLSREGLWAPERRGPDRHKAGLSPGHAPWCRRPRPRPQHAR